MRASGTPPVYIAGRGQDGGLQLHRGVVQPHPAPFWHPLSIPNRLRDADAQGNPNDLSDKPSTEPGQLHRTKSSTDFAKCRGKPDLAWGPVPAIVANRIGSPAVLEYGPTEILPPVGARAARPARLC